MPASDSPPIEAAEKTAVAPRRAYVPPRIVHREPLEAIAAVCAPSPPAKSNPGVCPMGPISS